MKVEVMEGELERRKLYNMVQEQGEHPRLSKRLCRFSYRQESEEEAKMVFPDQSDRKEIVFESSRESTLGQGRREVYSFAFDYELESRATEAEVFEEISMLAQSWTDRYKNKGWEYAMERQL